MPPSKRESALPPPLKSKTDNNPLNLKTPQQWPSSRTGGQQSLKSPSILGKWGIMEERRETDATVLVGRGRRSNCQREDCPHSREHPQGDNHTPREGRRRRTLMMTLSAQDDKSSWESLMRWTLFALCLCLSMMSVSGDDHVGLTNNNWERPGVMPKISHLEVMCGNQHMEVHLAFDKPFHGLVSSKGMFGQSDCIYVPPRTGKSQFVFNIYYDKCGTKPDNHGKFYENTIVVQYDEELIEAWDEAKRLRCEWFNDYEKTATKTSPMVISDLEIVELNFHGDNVDCWMEIQEGKGPWAAPLNGIAPLGSTLTMVIAVKDPSGEFDMRVKECEASDGHTGRNLALSDPEGCIVRPKLLGKFSKVKLDDGRATVLTYAFISAFKFPDMLNVHLRCTVEICRHGCPDHCTSAKKGPLLGAYSENEPVPAQSQNTVSKVQPPPQSPKPQKEDAETNAIPDNNLKNHQAPFTEIFNAQVPPQMRPPPPPLPHPHLQYGGRPQRAPRPHPHPHPNKFPPGILRQRPDMHRYPGPPPPPPPHVKQQLHPRFTGTIKHTLGPAQDPVPEKQFVEEQQRHHSKVAENLENMLMKPEPKKDESSGEEGTLSERSGEPEGEESSKEEMQNDAPAMNAEEEGKKKVVGEIKEKVQSDREMLMEAQPLKDELPLPSTPKTPEASPFPVFDPSPSPSPSPAPSTTTNFPKGPRNLRLRRSVPGGSSDTIGVQGAFKVVSQADLNFVMNSNSTYSTPTIVLRGKMSHGEPIYGICLPRVGFGMVFFGLGLATLVSILIAAFLAYAHYTLNHYKPQPHPFQRQEGGGGGLHSMQSVQMPLPYEMFPMVILRKMW